MMTTNLELFLSAQAAAIKNFTVALNHTLHGNAWQIFNDEGHDPRDWDVWYGYFNGQRSFCGGLSTQKSAATVAIEAEQKAQAEADAALAKLKK